MVLGIDLTAAPRSAWMRELGKFGERLQEEISSDFAVEKVAGQHLRRNSRAWNEYKATHGLDPRKGHAHGKLQRALGGKRLFNVTLVGTGANAKGYVTFSENRLQGRVRHAEYYAEKKAPGGRILALSERQVQAAATSLETFSRAAARRSASKAAKARTAQATVAARVRDLTNEFERRAAFAKAAPFAGRPQFIRPGLGLTRPFLRNLRSGR